MYIAITIVIVVLSVLLTLFVLVQNSKGGGLSAGFSSSNQIMGVRKTTDFVEKMTWGLVVGVIVLSIAAVGIHKNQAVVSDDESEIKEQVQKAKQAEPGVVAPNFGENPEANAPEQQPAAPAKK